MVQVRDHREIVETFIRGGYSLSANEKSSSFGEQIWWFRQDDFETMVSVDRMDYVQAEVQISDGQWVSARSVVRVLDELEDDNAERSLSDLVADVAEFRVRAMAGLPPDLLARIEARGARIAMDMVEQVKREREGRTR
jgi:hypothetical protein